jgi:ATP-dependent Lon protease
MTAKPDKIDPEGSATEARDVSLTGAAADSAEADENLKQLPRLLRYAMLSVRNDDLTSARLTAEIAELCPDLPHNLVWSIHPTAENGVALAAELDFRAASQDQPDLRSLADCVRLLCLPFPTTEACRSDHGRVAKALLLACRALPATDSELASEIEEFCWGWAAMPIAQDVLGHFYSTSAAANASVIGSKMARLRIAEAARAVENRFEKEEKRREEKKEEATAEAVAKAKTQAPDPTPADHLVVCRLDQAALKNTRMKDITASLKAVINTALPLTPVPPLDEVRKALVFEFPYAEPVIDVALADLVGRTTIRLRPLLLVGDPGGGKSRFARRLGELLRLTVWRTDASGSDGAVFGGTDRRWHSSEPCHPFLAIARGKTANPLVLLDELEKAGTRADYGRLWDCLLGFLEPESNCRYPDPALQTNLDLSQVSYVATANTLDALPSPLRDRFRVVTFPKPTAADLDALLPSVIADLATERGLDHRWVAPLTGHERDAVAAHWQGGSVRRLRRVVEGALLAREQAAVRN